LSLYIREVINFIVENTILVKKDGCDFKCDILKKNNVRSVYFENLKIEDRDIQIINYNFSNLHNFNSRACTYYKDCNLGVLSCDLIDIGSYLYGLDMLNGFSGKVIRLTRTKIKRMNNNFLHINSVILVMRGIDLDFEKFFLTTDAANLRKLCIYRSPKYKKLTDKDLLFISGFYSLESIDIDAFISDYNQIKKLEKLRRIDRIFCVDENKLNQVSNLRKEYVKKFLESGMTESGLKNYLMTQRMLIQNNYQDFFHKLYVPRLERVKWEDKINKK